MLLDVKRSTCVAAILVTSMLAVEAGQMIHSPGICHDGVNCTPRRITYGYYPTMWRRWPSEGGAASKPEKVPTPAEQGTEIPMTPERQQPDDEPIMIPEPGMQRSPADELLPPVEDTPPFPPQDSPSRPRDEMTPRRSIIDQQRSAPAAAPADEDAPPKMPQDDPFKDDPETPAPSPQSFQRRTRISNASKILERRAQALAEPAADPVEAPIKQLPRGEEPELVAPSEPPRTVDIRESEKLEDGPRRNPLRPAAARVRPQAVVPAASWSREPAPSAEASTNWRRNPLRAN